METMYGNCGIAVRVSILHACSPFEYFNKTQHNNCGKMKQENWSMSEPICIQQHLLGYDVDMGSVWGYCLDSRPGFVCT